jgi:GTP-binding protein HflX
MGEITTENKLETAVLVGIILPTQNDEQVEEYLDELAFLTSTLGAVTLKKFTQRLDKPDSRGFVGSGKLQEIKTYIDENEVDLVVFDDDLSPSQLRNIENFLQVELARYQYLLPRLTNMWTHLERQRGGTGTRGGAGEKEIETDRRIIRKKISLLQEKLKDIDKQMATRRKHRDAMVRVALVGYTNVGKSTLMNLISKADVFAENKLFATLDTTVRKVVLGNLPFLLSDTVGFIRKLPHQLVESFKSTLDEVRESDLLLHVVDISHPNFEEHIKVVSSTIKELEAANIPIIMVFNKVDQYRDLDENEFDYTGNNKQVESLERLKKTWMAHQNTDVIFISALKKKNIPEFKDLVYKKVREIHERIYPYNNFLYPDIPEES